MIESTPTVKFVDKDFPHPHVSSNGHVCLRFIQESAWRPGSTLLDVSDDLLLKMVLLFKHGKQSHSGTQNPVNWLMSWHLSMNVECGMQWDSFWRHCQPSWMSIHTIKKACMVTILPNCGKKIELSTRRRWKPLSRHILFHFSHDPSSQSFEHDYFVKDEELHFCWCVVVVHVLPFLLVDMS